MKNLSLIIFISLLLPITGCTFYHVNAEEIVTAYKGDEKQLKDIPYLETVTGSYKVIGHVTVETERRNSKDEVIEKMRRQVASLGGDAITNIVQEESRLPYTTIRTRYTATVIAYTSSDNPTVNKVTEENLK